VPNADTTEIGVLFHRCSCPDLGAAFIPNWHIRAIAYQLQRVRTGDGRKGRALPLIFATIASPGCANGLR